MNYLTDFWKKSMTLIMLLSMMTFLVSHAQGTLTGQVVDAASQEPLPGVSVKIKGTAKGTATDANGTFSLQAEAGAILQISYTGYLSKEVTMKAGERLVIALQADLQALDEVVVVGYGTQRKGSLTGAVGTVSKETFQDRGPVANPLAALQGQVAGVTVTRSSAQPGRESWNFQMRGATSVNGTEALVIIDGVPIPGVSALNSVNPNDIDNISFLKDAAAASIYGARAAGGVVLITTKRATAGKPVIQYNGSLSIKSVGLLPKLVDVNGWGPMIEEARLSDGFGAEDLWINLARASIYAKQNGLNYLTRQQYIDQGFLGFTDVRDFMFFDGTMQDVLWGNATSQEHQLSISGKGEKSGYRISLGYLNDGSLLQYGNNNNKRYNLRLSHDYQITDKFKLQSNISLERNDIVQPSGLGGLLNNGVQPGMPTSTINGKPYIWGSGIGNVAVNNIAEYGGDNKELHTRINTNFNLSYQFNEHLSANAAVGYYFYNRDNRVQENLVNYYDYLETAPPIALTSTGTNRNFYQRGARRENYYTGNVYLQYQRLFDKKHDFKVMGGVQYERNDFNRFLGRTLDVLDGVPPSLSNSFGDPTTKSVAETQGHNALAGYFGRLNYSYKGRYLLEVNGRYDGSSRFRAQDRWKLFGGVSAAWRIKDENFLKDADFLNDLKIRASWGAVGNQSGIGLYDYYEYMRLDYSTGPSSSGFPIIGTSPAVRLSPQNLVAYDRTWEQLETTNVGLDFAFLNNRLSGSADYFVKRNKNMLLARTFPAVLGATAPQGNNGELKTNGWELSLNWRDKIGNVNYRIGGNISDAKNELVNFGGQKLIQSTNQGFNSAVEGYPINSYFGLVYDGRIQTQQQLDSYIAAYKAGSNVLPQGTGRNNGLQLGDNMFKDVNGDGKITFPDDAVFLGTDDPRYSFAVTGGFDWKGFDMNFIFQGVGKRAILRTGNWRIPGAVVYQAQNEAYYNKWWTPERTDAEYPRISSTGNINNYNYFPSDFVQENGAYLRLKNLVFGYTLPKTVTDKLHIERLRIYFSGNDLWEISKIRDGWDPEAPRSVSNEGDSDNNNVHTVSQRFPFYRFYTFGINLTL
jgi:TonB-linked SusC/RagA family outer membrane protein